MLINEEKLLKNVQIQIESQYENYDEHENQSPREETKATHLMQYEVPIFLLLLRNFNY